MLIYLEYQVSRDGFPLCKKYKSRLRENAVNVSHLNFYENSHLIKTTGYIFRKKLQLSSRIRKLKNGLFFVVNPSAYQLHTQRKELLPFCIKKHVFLLEDKCKAQISFSRSIFLSRATICAKFCVGKNMEKNHWIYIKSITALALRKAVTIYFFSTKQIPFRSTGTRQNN